ncbi:MAG: hypothetical protein RLZZ126_339 [Pseudomonadota bacterium]|jgi:predicted neuraminidase
MPPGVPSAHASNLLVMPPSHRCALMAFWFAGSRESAPDVKIAQSCLRRADHQWLAAQIVADRHVLGMALGQGLRRLGNPVSWLDAHGRVHLFVVATGLGGWAASRILHVRAGPSDEAGVLRFEDPRILPMSWLWNLSFLVRGAPQPLEDGGFVLPVYFEIGTKTPFALRFDAAANLLGITRMSDRHGILQPSIVPLNAKHWIALMRDNRIDGKVAAAQTTDGGATWRDMRDLNVPNPDSAIFALPLGPWQAVLAHNSSPKSRQVLALSESGNGLDWSKLATLADGTQVTVDGETRAAEFSYPAMAWAEGSLWVAYTENRQRIAWVRLRVKD